MSDLLESLDTLTAAARQAGADHCDAMAVRSESLATSVRLGKLESIEQSDATHYGIRVFVGKRQNILSTNDPKELVLLAQKAVDMAKLVPEDPFAGLPDGSLCQPDTLDLDSADPQTYSAKELQDWAHSTEDAALAVEGVSNSEGANAVSGRSQVAYLSSNGFSGEYAQTYSALSVSAVAGSGEGMEREGEYTQAVYASDLMSSALLGKKAGELAVSRLQPRAVKTGQYPVVLHRRMTSRYLLQPFVGAISGPSIARGVSFLRDKMGQGIFSDEVTLVDDPLKSRGLGSQLFDGEGVTCRPQEIVKDGVLNSWLLNVRSANQLGLVTNGHASRSVGGAPGVGVSNFYMQAGHISFDELLRDVGTGFYVTQLMGFGINATTGDLSLGASGYWIEDGEVAYPVSGLTIAGNLQEMFLHARPANDLVFDGAVVAPTTYVGTMMVAGQ